MSEQEVHSSVPQRIVFGIARNEGVIPSPIHSRLKRRSGDECLSQPQSIGDSPLKKFG